MKFEFKKASKKQSKLRCALYGPSGSGKTFTALAIAHGMSNKIGLIDTERGSADKYADRKEEPIFNFESLKLTDHSVQSYISAIQLANKLGFEVLIIDSLSHAWQAILEDIDKLAKGKFKGNTWSAWSEGTPMQKKLINALLDYNGHLIATMRAKTDWLTDASNGGKSRPVRVGLAPEQGKGIEYEFDLLMEISTDHIGEVIKDRTGKFQDKSFTKPGKEFGEQLIAWLSEGEQEAPKATKIQIESLKDLFKQLNISDDKITKGCAIKGCNALEEMKSMDIDLWINSLLERKNKETILSANDKDTNQLVQEI